MHVRSRMQEVVGSPTSRVPTGLADGFGVGSRLSAYAEYTPRVGSPVPVWRRNSALTPYQPESSMRFEAITPARSFALLLLRTDSR
jgi:hypothetical protein